ncbi:MAG: LUD domain-containing protein [Hyphomicrobiales bacterium]|nr:LUD domain-containing protein [Hyphomicrobiales bacterium]
MSAREAILARLRATAATAPTLDVDAYFAHRAVPALEQRVADFARRLESQHADVVVADKSTWATRLAGILATEPPRRLLVDCGCAQAGELVAALDGRTETVEFARPIEAWKEELFDAVDAGFSVAVAGIADLGALVFASGPAAARCVSLVPALHIAWIDAAKIHPDLYSANLAERWSAAMPTNLVFVSGPSKTSDIQQTVAYGAHGPRRLIVVVVVPPGRAGVPA